MAKALAYVALVALILTLGSTLLAIWLKQEVRKDLLDLTSHLLSWQVIAGGLVVGGGHAFKDDIKTLLKHKRT